MEIFIWGMKLIHFGATEKQYYKAYVEITWMPLVIISSGKYLFNRLSFMLDFVLNFYAQIALQ